jgi:hypothetical protein
MAELPEIAAAKNFVTAMARFPRIAATTAVFPSCATYFVDTFASRRASTASM